MDLDIGRVVILSSKRITSKVGFVTGSFSSYFVRSLKVLADEGLCFNYDGLRSTLCSGAKRACSDDDGYHRSGGVWMKSRVFMVCYKSSAEIPFSFDFKEPEGFAYKVLDNWPDSINVFIYWEMGSWSSNHANQHCGVVFSGELVIVKNGHHVFEERSVRPLPSIVVGIAQEGWVNLSDCVGCLLFNGLSTDSFTLSGAFRLYFTFMLKSIGVNSTKDYAALVYARDKPKKPGSIDSMETCFSGTARDTAGGIHVSCSWSGRVALAIDGETYESKCPPWWNLYKSDSTLFIEGSGNGNRNTSVYLCIWMPYLNLGGMVNVVQQGERWFQTAQGRDVQDRALCLAHSSECGWWAYGRRMFVGKSHRDWLTRTCYLNVFQIVHGRVIWCVSYPVCIVGQHLLDAISLSHSGITMNFKMNSRLLMMNHLELVLHKRGTFYRRIAGLRHGLKGCGWFSELLRTKQSLRDCGEQMDLGISLTHVWVVESPLVILMEGILFLVFEVTATVILSRFLHNHTFFLIRFDGVDTNCEAVKGLLSMVSYHSYAHAESKQKQGSTSGRSGAKSVGRNVVVPSTRKCSAWHGHNIYVCVSFQIVLKLVILVIVDVQMVVDMLVQFVWLIHADVQALGRIDNHDITNMKVSSKCVGFLNGFAQQLGAVFHEAVRERLLSYDTPTGCSKQACGWGLPENGVANGKGGFVGLRMLLMDLVEVFKAIFGIGLF